MITIAKSIIGISEITVSQQIKISEKEIKQGIEISEEWDTVAHIVRRNDKNVAVRKLDDKDKAQIISFDDSGVFLNEDYELVNIKYEENRFAKVDLKNFVWKNKEAKFENGQRMLCNKICLAEFNWDGVHGKGYDVQINLPGYDQKDWKTQPDIKSAKELCERIVSRWFIEMGAIFE